MFVGVTGTESLVGVGGATGILPIALIPPAAPPPVPGMTASSPAAAADPSSLLPPRPRRANTPPGVNSFPSASAMANVKGEDAVNASAAAPRLLWRNGAQQTCRSSYLHHDNA